MLFRSLLPISNMRIYRHEEIYFKLQDKLVRSDDLAADPVVVERKLGSTNVILCTLSMLSNVSLDTAGIFNLVPMVRLIVDEASQIDTFEFFVSLISPRALQVLLWADLTRPSSTSSTSLRLCRRCAFSVIPCNVCTRSA